MPNYSPLTSLLQRPPPSLGLTYLKVGVTPIISHRMYIGLFMSTFKYIYLSLSLFKLATIGAKVYIIMSSLPKPCCLENIVDLLFKYVCMCGEVGKTL